MLNILVCCALQVHSALGIACHHRRTPGCQPASSCCRCCTSERATCLRGRLGSKHTFPGPPASQLAFPKPTGPSGQGRGTQRNEYPIGTQTRAPTQATTPTAPHRVPRRQPSHSLAHCPFFPHPGRMAFISARPCPHGVLYYAVNFPMP